MHNVRTGTVYFMEQQARVLVESRLRVDFVMAVYRLCVSVAGLCNNYENGFVMARAGGRFQKHGLPCFRRVGRHDP